jgi:hypothetical protein
VSSVTAEQSAVRDRGGWLAKLAGPALIVTVVLIALHEVAFGTRITTADVRVVWLPTYCLMGKSLAHGHLLAWNPHILSGTPFAADPQSGWLYLPPMILFALLPCAAAIRWMIVLQPLLAGLGMYWFLRNEELSRPSATAGALVMAMAIAGSELAVSLPFAGALAWTTLTLGACSRALRAARWSSRVGWCLLTALAWGQIAAAHFSVGLIFGTGALATFAIAKIAVAIRASRSSAVEVLRVLGLLAPSLVLVNLGFLVPRLAFLGETSLSLGYGRLQQLSSLFAGTAPRPLRIGAIAGFSWPLKLSLTSGTYLGASALALAFAGWWSRRRALAAVFTLFGAACYVLSLGPVAARVPASLRSMKLVDLYLHNPQWLGYPVLLALAVLAGLGIEAWLEASSTRRRMAMLVPGVVLWWVLPVTLGAGASRLWLLGIGAVLGIAAFAATARRPALAILVPAVLAVELLANTFVGAARSPFRPMPALLVALPNPSTELSSIVEPGPIQLALRRRDEGRYVVTGRAAPVPRSGGGGNLGVVPDHAMLFGTETAGGYDPVQLIRYWAFVRAIQHASVRYNRALFPDPPPVALDLLQVRYALASAAEPPVPGATLAVTQGAWALWELPDAQPRASVLTAWRVLKPSGRDPAGDEALMAVTAADFDPQSEVVLERDPGLGPPGNPGAAAGATATYTAEGPQGASVRVSTPVPSVVLLRIPYEKHWHATVDGHSSRVIPADYVDQAVPVPAGIHTIDLTYSDPSIGAGLAGSAVVIVGMLASAVWLRRRERLAGRGGQAGPEAEPTAEA